MPISDHMVKPMKKGQPNWRGTPQMKEVTDTEAWDAAKKFADDLDNMSAVDLLFLIASCSSVRPCWNGSRRVRSTSQVSARNSWQVRSKLASGSWWSRSTGKNI